MERIVGFFYPDWQGAALIVLLIITCITWAFAHYSYIGSWDELE